MLTARRKDWLRAYAAPAGLLTFELVLFAAAATAVLQKPASAWATMLFCFVVFIAVIGFLATISEIKRAQLVRYSYALVFQKWQDHELPDPRETDRTYAMIDYCEKRRIPHRVRYCHGVPYRIEFLYEEDLHEANLAV